MQSQRLSRVVEFGCPGPPQCFFNPLLEMDHHASSRSILILSLFGPAFSDCAIHRIQGGVAWRGTGELADDILVIPDALRHREESDKRSKSGKRAAPTEIA